MQRLMGALIVSVVIALVEPVGRGTRFLDERPGPSVIAASW